MAIFDNDRDPQAEEKTLRYIATGEVPEDAAQPGAPEEATTPEEGTDGGTGTPAPSGSGNETDVGERLEDVIRRQRELLEEVEDLREALRAQDGG